MAVDLYLSGASGSTDLYLGGSTAGITTTLGTVTFTGFGVELKSTILFNPDAPGQVLFSGLPGNFTEIWREYPPSAQIIFTGFPIEIEQVSVPVYIETTCGIAEFSGYAGTITQTLNFSPGSVIPGYSCDGTNIIIPISSLPGLSVEEASTDWREFFQAICLMDALWYEIFGVYYSPTTYRSWRNNNLNHKSEIYQYGVGELVTFLKHFSVTYAASKLKEEN